MSEKYPEHQMYCKADPDGKFAGAVLAHTDNGVNNDAEIDQWLADGAFPVTHGPGTTNQHGRFLMDEIRWDGTKFYDYVKPESLVLAEELAAKKNEKLSTLQQNYTDAKYVQEKFVDGALTAEEYAPMKTLRQTWRDQINAINAATTIAEVDAINVVKWEKSSS